MRRVQLAAGTTTLCVYVRTHTYVCVLQTCKSRGSGTRRGGNNSVFSLRLGTEHKNRWRWRQSLRFCQSQNVMEVAANTRRSSPILREDGHLDPS